MCPSVCLKQPSRQYATRRFQGPQATASVSLSQGVPDCAHSGHGIRSRPSVAEDICSAISVEPTDETTCIGNKRFQLTHFSVLVGLASTIT